MATASHGMQSALCGVEQLLESTPSDAIAVGNWRWTLRQRLTAVRDALMTETNAADASWLAPRGGVALRDRTALLMRLGAMGPAVLETPDPDEVRAEVKRLIADVRHHVQRLNDLAYDEVEAEIGGSE